MADPVSLDGHPAYNLAKACRSTPASATTTCPEPSK